MGMYFKKKLEKTRDQNLLKSEITKAEIKHGDIVHLSNGISDPKGGEKIDRSKKFVVRGKQKTGYHPVHWIVPEGEKNSKKGSYYRTDRLHHAGSITKADNFFTQAKQKSQMRGLGSVTSQGARPQQQTYQSKMIQGVKDTKQKQRDSALQSFKEKKAKMAVPGRVDNSAPQLPPFFSQHKGVIPHDHPHREQAVKHILGVWREDKKLGSGLSDRYLTGKKHHNLTTKSEILLTPIGKYKSNSSEIFGLELIKSNNKLIDYIVLFKKEDGSIESQPSFVDSSKNIASSILSDYKDKIT